MIIYDEETETPGTDLHFDTWPLDNFMSDLFCRWIGFSVDGTLSENKMFFFSGMSVLHFCNQIC